MTDYDLIEKSHATWSGDERRKDNSDAIENMHRRMDTQDKILLEIRDKIIAHLAAEEQVKPALDELISLWKGSKILIPILASAAAMVWAVFAWAKDHVK